MGCSNYGCMEMECQCADFSTGPNAALEDKHYLPIAEDIFTTFNDGTCFAELNLSDLSTGRGWTRMSWIFDHQHAPGSITIYWTSVESENALCYLPTDNGNDIWMIS